MEYFFTPRMTAIYIILLFLAGTISISGASSSLLITHNQSAVSQINNTAWEYTVSVTGGTGPTGIIENIPSGFTYQSSNLPEHQTISGDTKILFSLPDGGDLTFTITGTKNAEGLLTGSCTDLVTGITIPLSSLFLSDGIITTREQERAVTPVSENKHTGSPGFDLVITTIAFAVIAVCIVWRRKS